MSTTVKVLVFAIFFSNLYTLALGQPPCGTVPFPKTLAGAADFTFLHSIDYHAGTDSLVGAGYVRDYPIRGPNTLITGYVGLIALFQGPQLDLVWGKTNNNFKHLYPVEFSTDGSLVVTTTCCSGN